MSLWRIPSASVFFFLSNRCFQDFGFIYYFNLHKDNLPPNADRSVQKYTENILNVTITQ